MSHELRTPLNAILGFAQIMNRAPNLTARQKQNLDTMILSGEHLLALINGVLDLSKIEAGQIDLHPQAFDLRHMLAELEEMFSLRAGQKGLSLVFEPSPEMPRYVRTDHARS